MSPALSKTLLVLTVIAPMLVGCRRAVCDEDELAKVIAQLESPSLFRSDVALQRISPSKDGKEPRLCGGMPPELAKVMTAQRYETDHHETALRDVLLTPTISTRLSAVCPEWKSITKAAEPDRTSPITAATLGDFRARCELGRLGIATEDEFVSSYGVVSGRAAILAVGLHQWLVEGGFHSHRPGRSPASCSTCRTHSPCPGRTGMRCHTCPVVASTRATIPARGARRGNSSRSSFGTTD